MQMYNELPCFIEPETIPRKYVRGWHRETDKFVDFEVVDYEKIQTELRSLFASIAQFFDPKSEIKVDWGYELV